MHTRGGALALPTARFEQELRVNVSSALVAAKAALATMSVHLSKVFAQTGITSNVLSPGIIVTDAVKTFFGKLAADRGWGLDPADWPAIEHRIQASEYPIAASRLGLPCDVADPVVSSPVRAASTSTQPT